MSASSQMAEDDGDYCGGEEVAGTDGIDLTDVDNDDARAGDPCEEDHGANADADVSLVERGEVAPVAKPVMEWWRPKKGELYDNTMIEEWHARC
jgi:hypothetical protein